MFKSANPGTLHSPFSSVATFQPLAWRSGSQNAIDVLSLAAEIKDFSNIAFTVVWHTLSMGLESRATRRYASSCPDTWACRIAKQSFAEMRAQAELEHEGNGA